MKTRFFSTILLGIIALGLSAQTATSYLTYDYAFFELKGNVRAVKINYNNQYSEVHEFSHDGILLNEEADGVEEFDYNPFGYIRDEYGRIIGTGNSHSAWTWSGKTLVSMHFSHQGDEFSHIYIYDEAGKRLGYKDEDGVHKYDYTNYDARGNWIVRYIGDDYCEKR